MSDVIKIGGLVTKISADRKQVWLKRTKWGKNHKWVRARGLFRDFVVAGFPDCSVAKSVSTFAHDVDWNSKH